MTLDGEALRETLAAAGLSAAEPVPGASDEGTVWLLPIDSGNWFGTWQRLRALVPKTGRWPLAVTNVATGWDQPPTPGRRDVRPGQVLRRLTAVDVPSELDDVEQDDLVPVDEWVEFQLEDTEGLCGQAPTVDDLRSAVGDPVAETVAERWLLDWELAHCPDAGLDDPASYLSWFEPGEGVKIMLSPRPEPWSAAVYAGHYGNDWPDSDLRPALVRDWCVRYGAEPVANWETMQQFVIRRPPATLDQAWEVARAQALLWPDTYRLPGVNVRQMARDLVGRDRWFLHLRP